VKAGERTALPVGERVAAVDIGTNTVLLTVAERVSSGGDLAGRLLVVAEQHAITRLGQGVDRSRALAADAIDRTLACLERYRDEAARLGVGRTVCVGTSALRDAEGGAPFVLRASSILGCAVEVVTGRREAELTFRGAISGLAFLSGDASADGCNPNGDNRVMAFDVGGGSTEVVIGTSDGMVESAVSLDVGSVRLFERYGDEGFDEALRALRSALPPRPVDTPHVVLGIAGTMTTLWSLAYGVPFEEHLTGSRLLRTETIAAFAANLRAMPVSARRDQLGIDAGRADVLPFGALVAAEILRWAGAHETRVTSRGVRYGLLLEALADEALAD
jgi:exopolyphosphatase/guanosine-5'-triphosphate,3'-diphosphate pyrophosphatase